MNKFIVTATRSMKNYAHDVAQKLAEYHIFAPIADSIDRTDILDVMSFADGEIEVVINESVRGKDVIVFSNASHNEENISLDQAKLELYHTVDALKRAQAERIIVFEPFISCARSDRTTRRNSVGLWMHFRTLTALGTRHIITYQLHSKMSKSMLAPSVCTLDDIPGIPLLQRYLCDMYVRSKEALENDVNKNWVFCSVDAGGEKLARTFADAFNAPLVVAHKQRDYNNPNSINSISVLKTDDLAGKKLWIVDDMIDTGKSVEILVNALADMHPVEINLVAVHAVLSGSAEERLRAMAESKILKRVIVTDTVCCAGIQERLHPLIEVVPSRKRSAKIIRTIMANQSMSERLKPFSAERYFSNEAYLFNSRPKDSQPV
ncbi:MAG: ribose-phosphate diphosphokinase [Treponema sp.]|jgi:ribose-phosphate pyrophosphokinase|nr:ribose-phosphate diphosphokinase [Treponema sp.]